MEHTSSHPTSRRPTAAIQAARSAARERGVETDTVVGGIAEGATSARLLNRAVLVVIGARGVRGIRALGSVSERVAHAAPCSVLVARG
jgi:nucleotide-binding universal stress UspA family protein